MGKMCPIVMRRFSPTLLICACLLATVQSKAVAFDLKGRTVTLYVGGGPGGGVDIFARTLAPYLGRYLPGEPAVVVSNMPGNGGMQAVQYAYSIAARDGTALGTTNSGPVVEPLLNTTIQLNYEMPKFQFVGSLLKGDMICAVWHGSRIKTLADAREREVTMSSTGATSSPLRAALLVNTLIGTRFKPISGFHVGTALLALERGEVDGICNTLSSLRTSRPDWLREGKFVPLVQVSLTGDAEIPHVPRVADFVTREDDRQLLEFSGLPYEFDNPYYLPPGAPADALAAYRAAFEAATRDPAYRRDATQRGQNIQPRNGADVTGLVARLYATPKAVIQRMIAATTPRN